MDKKGVVTPLSSLFPVEESRRAAKNVENIISEKHRELETLRQFIVDNSNIVNLVSKLPDELQYDVMVPFGDAAFFPGQLLHTNEFMVLLGEGYYVERTAKQTVEILDRRGKVLKSQVESLKANINDLRAEALFFDASASEAAEGLVEICEDYVEETSARGHLDSDEAKIAVEDDEYIRLMSRLDELEKEETAAECRSEGDEREVAISVGNSDNENSDDTASDGNNSFDESHCQNSPTPTSEAEDSCPDYISQLAISDKPRITELSAQHASRDEATNKKTWVQSEAFPSKPEVFRISKVKENFRRADHMGKEAFTGSIVERMDNLETDVQAASRQPSKPVSRFKMQRR